MDIPPEIRKFWGDREILTTRHGKWIYYYVLRNKTSLIVAVNKGGDPILKYWLENGEEYSEEEMLRIIQLKAFL